MAEVSLAHFGQILKTSKNKKVNFDPLKNFQKNIFFIFCLNMLMKGYKSHSRVKFTKIYPLWQVAPSGPTSQNKGKSSIFDDFDKNHDFQRSDFRVELLKITRE